MKRVYHILTLFIVITACSDDIDLPEAQEIVVVEGWLNDQDTIQQLKLTRTVGYNTKSTGSSIENAIVSVRSTRDIFNFEHTINGNYVSSKPFAGITGVSYWVEINIAGEVIQSIAEKMVAAPQLDSLGYDSFFRQSEDQSQLNEIIFFPVGYFSDDQNEQNYYRWRFKNNQVFFTSATDIYIQEDRFFNGLENIKNEFVEFEFKLNDTIYAEIQEITFDAYDYLRLLKLQTTSLGTRSGTTPSVVQGNLFYKDNPSQLVLGYFGVISTNSRNQIIVP